ncbi:uncharacterized protein BDCG_07660 [Blastomyces dermatitidis ER-3]|uniref:Uncharacterized protein n=1 Tax=Ajellomyces dermatitidis (strain ER-3 / ATCC MYA-2586) TaxID=559297 RepID=A0ABP2F7R3_AJEDR|nr:uncharacterized protein BDCG_07660 [Blastomyces dermatitidis ER-3]EEQ92540.1 hypothetical protein BDCG_07660 [Blastomyces dermatitidis ER-3]
MAEKQPTTAPAIPVPSAGQVPSTPGTNEAVTRSLTDNSLPREATSIQGVADDVLAEYNAALAADPSLRSATPNQEWEDYETILAQNPELMAPIVANKTNIFYTSKNKWECGHEGPEMPTDIEKETDDDDDDGRESTTLINECRGLCPDCLDPDTNPALHKETIVDGKVFYMSKDKWECGHEGEEIRTDIEQDSLDIQADKPSVLINEVKGICPTCMDKWHKLESGDGEDGGDERGGPSAGPAGTASSNPPTYDEALEANGQYDQDDEEDRLIFQVGLLDLDDGPTKGKNAERGGAAAESPGVEDATPSGSGSRMKATEDAGYETRASTVYDDDDNPDDGYYNNNPVDQRGYDGNKDANYHSSGGEEEISGRKPHVEIEIDSNAQVAIEVEVNPGIDSVKNAGPEQKKPGQ